MSTDGRQVVVEAVAIPPEVDDLLALLGSAGVFFRGIPAGVHHDAYFVPFRDALPAHVRQVVAAVSKSNVARCQTGLRRLNPLLRLALVDALGTTLLPAACAPDLAAVAPPVVAFPAVRPYENDRLHFYCESAACLHAFLTTLEKSGDKAAFDQEAHRLKGMTREELRNLFGDSITRVACISMFPTPHMSDHRDYGIVLSFTNIPGKKRQTLAQSALKNCADQLRSKEKAPGVLYEIPPADDVSGSYRKRKHVGTAGRPRKRPRLEPHTHPADVATVLSDLPFELLLSGHVTEGDAVAQLDAMFDAWINEEAYHMPEPRVRGPATDARALAAVLVQCVRDAGPAALLKGLEPDPSDWSDYSDSDDEDDGEEYVLRSREPNVLTLHLRQADTEENWRDANELLIKLNSLVTDVCATVRNPSRTRSMEAHMVMMDKRGYTRLQLVRKGPAVLLPGATLTMKNDDSSFIISAPEDDKPVEGFFLLFYQWCTPDKHQPKWFVASRGYHLLPEGTEK